MLAVQVSFSLEGELQAELDLPGCCGRLVSGNAPGTREGLADSIVGQIRVEWFVFRHTQVGAVEEVEEFGPERQVLRFPKLKPLGQREVQADHPGSDDDIVTLIVLGRKGPHGFPFRRPHSHFPIH